MVVGLGLVVLGLRSWRRHRRSDAARVAGWASAVDALSGIRAFGVGVLMALRPKNLLLATVVGLQLHVASLHTTVSVAIGVCYVVLATSTITVPILLAHRGAPADGAETRRGVEAARHGRPDPQRRGPDRGRRRSLRRRPADVVSRAPVARG